jgi:hypothetical protein
VSGLFALSHYHFPPSVERVRVFKDDAVVVDAVLTTTVMARGGDLCQHQRLHVVGSVGCSHGSDFVEMSTMIRGRGDDPNAQIDLSASTDLIVPARARGLKLGTLLVRRSIRFAHRHGHKQALVHGITLSHVDAKDPDNRARRDRLWSEAGFLLPGGDGGPLSQFEEKPDPSNWGNLRMQIDTVDAHQIAGMLYQASKHEDAMKAASAGAKDARERAFSAAIYERARGRRLAFLGLVVGVVVGATGMWKLLA